MSEQEVVDITPEKPPNPAAFPVLDDAELDRGPEREPEHCLGLVEPGMTLGDFFAAAALAGYIACFAGPGTNVCDPDEGAERAYAYSDAMLRRRALRRRGK